LAPFYAPSLSRQLMLRVPCCNQQRSRLKARRRNCKTSTITAAHTIGIATTADIITTITGDAIVITDICATVIGIVELCADQPPDPSVGQAMRLSTRLRELADRARRDALVLWLAARDPRTPWPSKLVAGLCAGYVISPIQVLPDWIPVVGYLDDVAVVSFGGWLVLKLMPRPLIDELREKAQRLQAQPGSRATAAAVLALWSAIALLLGLVVWR
jgi:uncharacterized membrane protein YkvA (DUF1232 family)